MDGFFESDLEKAGAPKQDAKGEKVKSQEMSESTPRYRYVTEEMLEKCWKMSLQSRAQSFSSSLSAVGRRDKLWDNGIFVPEIVGHRL